MFNSIKSEPFSLSSSYFLRPRESEVNGREAERNHASFHCIVFLFLYRSSLITLLPIGLEL